ncbi:MAG: aminoacyl-tRNA hydrolase [Flavobacteriales bacterium]|nr:aminoacyl-tRNA hydrolase [Flavobacteriales bacterium]
MNKEIIIKELIIKTSRSGGAGGQHVNKTETKVEVFFDVYQSMGLSTEEKKRLSVKLQSKLIKGSLLRIVSQESRSQLGNKEDAIKKLLVLLGNSIKIPKKRKPTKVPYSKIQKRLSDKKKKSDVKANRNWKSD